MCVCVCNSFPRGASKRFYAMCKPWFVWSHKAPLFLRYCRAHNTINTHTQPSAAACACFSHIPTSVSNEDEKAGQGSSPITILLYISPGGGGASDLANLANNLVPLWKREHRTWITWLIMWHLCRGPGGSDLANLAINVLPVHKRERERERERERALNLATLASNAPLSFRYCLTEGSWPPGE